MADAGRRFYWDACAWIGFINLESQKLNSLRAIWDEAKAGKCSIWTSVYSYVEVFKVKDDAGDAISVKDSISRVETMFSQPHVEMVQVDSIVARLARDLRIRHGDDGLDNRPDAIHVATAAHYNLDELHTWDKSHLLPLDGKVLRRDGAPLPIVKPGGAYAAGPMFSTLPGDDIGHRAASPPSGAP